jgi:hypothetical protein
VSESICYAIRAAGPGQSKQTYTKFEYVYSDDAGATTNLCCTGQSAEAIGEKEILPYSAYSATSDDITGTDLLIGVRVSLVEEENKTTTVTFYGGTAYPSHIATPGLDDVTGYITDAELAAIPYARRDETNTFTVTQTIGTGTRAMELVSNVGMGYPLIRPTAGSAQGFLIAAQNDIAYGSLLALEGNLDGGNLRLSAGTNASAVISFADYDANYWLDASSTAITAYKPILPSASNTVSIGSATLPFASVSASSLNLTTNSTSMFSGTLNGTNGVAFTQNGTNYWLLFQ